MKKFLLFLLCMIMLVALIYVSMGMIVCDFNTTINLKPLGLDYTCKCSHTNKYTNITFEVNE